MAMITDQTYLLHALRLATLRVTDDPHSSRVIQVSPYAAHNPYVRASGLSDVERWPEIRKGLESPPLEASTKTNGTHGSTNNSQSSVGLRYTQTIMGGRKGTGAGMRVSGDVREREPPGMRSRTSSASAASSSVAGSRRTPLTPIPQDRTPTASRPGSKDQDDLFAPQGRPPRLNSGSRSNSSSAAATLPPPPPPPPKRPRADSEPMPLSGPSSEPSASLAAGVSPAELGMGLHAGAGLLEQAMSLSISASDLDAADEDGDAVEEGSDLEEGSDDGMDLDLQARMRMEDQSLDVGLSAPRLQPRRPGDGLAQRQRRPHHRPKILLDPGSTAANSLASSQRPALSGTSTATASSSAIPRARSHREVPRIPSFRSIAPDATAIRSQTSALTRMLNISNPSAVSASPSSNPFTSLYASVAPPNLSIPSLELEFFYPHSTTPIKGLKCKVRKDATVEEVIGYGLYRYWEDGWEPKLDSGLPDDGEERDNRLSAVGWALRMVEDDGEVDEDFPALDRDSQVSKFSYGQFAICEATSSQIRQNVAKAPAIVRRPSRTIAVLQPPKRPAAVAAQQSSLAPIPANSAVSSSVMTTSTMTKTPGMGMSGGSGVPVLLRVRITASADVQHSTAINVPSDMYFADITEQLVRKKRLSNPKDWVLCLADLSVALPLDRTVASLEGKADLALVKRAWAEQHGLRVGRRVGGDPSASIFKRMSEPVNQKSARALDLTTYKKYVVQRKIAIGRHERILAIDGDYIHIMPSETKAFFDSMKTTSFHITSIASCKVTGRVGFKINVWRESGQKRYEFEAESSKIAAEIIASVRNLMNEYRMERSSPPSRLGRRL